MTHTMTPLFLAYWLTIQHTALSAVPTDTVMRLSRIVGSSDINIGEKSVLKMELDFPIGTTNNVVIEILSSLDATVLAFVRVLSAGIGSNIDQEKASILLNPVVYPGQEYVNAVSVKTLFIQTGNCFFLSSFLSCFYFTLVVT
ncbi:hypothetical protein ACJMK2_015833 [Sinanodonta woodiana]|uniref:Uncharacterized protein n=1 Tax=Sinanodonta woodiana TaxID=1069815 RepID=A0ABD3URW4_SINWO